LPCPDTQFLSLNFGGDHDPSTIRLGLQALPPFMPGVANLNYSLRTVGHLLETPLSSTHPAFLVNARLFKHCETKRAPENRPWAKWGFRIFVEPKSVSPRFWGCAVTLAETREAPEYIGAKADRVLS